MSEPFTLSIDELQPSQLYLNGRKLALATEWFAFDEPEYDPLPAREIDGEWVLLDGHTRAFLAALSGAEELVVYDDPEELSMEFYRVCVGWCKAEEITRVHDLFGRVLDAPTFVETWVERCHAADEYPD